jgi:quercetin dioxygenase-like cupin family protein
MRTVMVTVCMAAAALLARPAAAADPGTVKPNLVLTQRVAGMPVGDEQQVRVMTATFQSGDRTLFHTHRRPVTVYVVAGAFTLEMEVREPVTVKAGKAVVEPPNVKMTGYNRATTEPLKVVIF